MSNTSKVRLTLLLIGAIVSNSITGQSFADVTSELGIDLKHSYSETIDQMPLMVSGGIASNDINGDGLLDLVVSLGDNGIKILLLTEDNEYEDRTQEYGLDQENYRSTSPHFFNLNNDHYIDLILGSVDGNPPVIYINNKGKGFTKKNSEEFNSLIGKNTTSISDVDINNDGYQDLFFSHWMEPYSEDHIWINKGNGDFENADVSYEFYNPFSSGIDFMHTANFLDLNNDGFPDLLLCSDFETSQIWLNENGNKLIYQDQYNLQDQNSMGSAIGDFDNDGDYDWFTSSVYDDDGILEGNWGGSGNKLYLNDGDFGLEEVAFDYNVEDSSWGWASSFCDINNDGYLDIVVVNGWPTGSDQFKLDQLKIFINVEGHHFYDAAQDFGIDDALQGRGLSCFDYNNDGDIDILVSNFRGPVKVYENNLSNNNHYIKFAISGSEKNPFGIGTEILVYTEGMCQRRLINGNSNYISHNPYIQHFGLSQNTSIDSVVVKWNDNSSTKIFNVLSDQTLKIDKENYRNSVKEILISPNPSSELLSFSLQISDISDNIKIQISDLSGSKHMDINNYGVKGNTLFCNDININNLSPGIYLVHIITSDKSQSIAKFLKY